MATDKYHPHFRVTCYTKTGVTHVDSYYNEDQPVSTSLRHLRHAALRGRMNLLLERRPALLPASYNRAYRLLTERIPEEEHAEAEYLFAEIASLAGLCGFSIGHDLQRARVERTASSGVHKSLTHPTAQLVKSVESSLSQGRTPEKGNGGPVLKAAVPTRRSV